MNKILKKSLVCMIAFSAMVNAYANDHAINNIFSDEEIRIQIESLSSHVKMEYNEDVKKILNTYLTSYRESTQTIINRSHYYFPIFEKIITEHNLPQEIKYLSVVESSLNPIVRSRSGAVGLWQFMRGTARMYGLKVTNHYDERRDVTLSTKAAALYLNDLYTRFGDWGLAMAAYNCGPGNVQKAIDRAHSNNYWEIRKYLPKETRRYLPKYVAFAYLMQYSEQLGLGPTDEQFTEYTSFASSIVYAKTTLSYISQKSGLSKAEIIKYNPAYNHGVIPARKGGSTLILPEGAMLEYLSATNQMYALKDVFYLKNAIFYRSVPSEIIASESLELEVDNQFVERQSLMTEKLQKQSVNSLEAKKIDVVLNQQPSVVEFEEYKRIRLRKRESLKDLIKRSKNTLTFNPIMTSPASQVIVSRNN